MISLKVIQQLINAEVIKEIVAAAESRGYKSIALIKPVMESNETKLHFLVSPTKPGLSLFDHSRLVRRIKELVHSENIILLDESHFDPSAKHQIIGKICPLSCNSLDNIANFCREELTLKLKMDTRFENNKMILQVEMPEMELSDEEKGQYINSAASQFTMNLRSKLFPAAGNNLSLKSSA